MMKTILYVLFAIGTFIAFSEAAACKKGPSCDNAPSSQTRTIHGKKLCCLTGTISIAHGANTTSCTCKPIPGKSKPKSKPPYRVAPLDEFRQAALEEHNKYRALHGCVPLTLNDDLNEYAQEVAEHLVTIGRMQHSNGKLPNGDSVGENLAAMKWTAQVDFKGPEIVRMWYNEIRHYDYNSPGFSGQTGHFTQVVWKATTELGLGKARSADGKQVFAVGTYKIPGNRYGGFVENVPPLLSD